MPVQIWMRDDTQVSLPPAHWIKFFGGRYLTAACAAILPVAGSSEVDTERVSLANAVGRFYEKPTGQACPVCLERAKAQA